MIEKMAHPGSLDAELLVIYQVYGTDLIDPTQRLLNLIIRIHGNIGFSS